jgi:hypothetical protein
VTARKLPTSASNDADDLIGRLLSRIAAILVRLGLDSPQSERLLRKAFVQAALQRVRSVDLRPTQSKIASVAGLSRLEVRTILQGRRTIALPQTTRVDDLIFGWRADPQFLDSRGKPKPLDIRGTGATFDTLAKKYGRDVTPRSLRDELTRRGIVSIRKKKLVLLHEKDKFSEDVLAAQADLKFLASHLTAIDFQLGRRSYVLRQGAVAADDKRAVEMLKRIAVTRLDTVFRSLATMSVDAPSNRKRKQRRSRRLLVSAIVATEAEDKKT